MKLIRIFGSSLLVLVASSGCALLDGGGGNGDGDGDGDGDRPFGSGKGDGDGDVAGDGDGGAALTTCTNQCQAQAQCDPSTDVSQCNNDCEIGIQEANSAGCGRALATVLRCIDPCDESSVSACESVITNFLQCMEDGPVGTGGAPSGTGGAPGAGGVVQGSGGVLVGSGGAPVVGAGGAPSGPAFNSAIDGLGTTPVGGWHGYFFTVADSWGGVISPAEGEPFVGNSICAAGYTAADWEGFGIIGFNIAQEIDPETLAGGLENEIDPGGSGVSVSVQNNGGSPLRVQIQNNSGTSWCAVLPASGTGTIPWTSFNTMCWDPPLGTYYTPGTPISQVMVQAPASTNLSPTAYDFCIVTLDLAL